MSAATAMTGLRARLQTVPGLTVIKGVPNTIQKSHLGYVAYTGGSNAPKDTTRGLALVGRHVWRFAVRVCVSMHENTIAEDEIIAYADSVPAAIWADLTLGGNGTILRSIEQSAEGEDGYLEVRGSDGSTVGSYRSIVFRIEVVDKP